MMKKKDIIAWVFILASLALSLPRCNKPELPEELAPAVLNDTIEVYADHVVFSWEVEYPGKIGSVIELGLDSLLEDAYRFGMEEIGDDKSFEVHVDSLAYGTKYYYRHIVWNRYDSYPTRIRRFTTKAIAPTVTTDIPIAITSSSVNCSGNVTSDGGTPVTERGVCWGTSINPTIDGDHLAYETGGTGFFQVSIVRLDQVTTYHVRAYAINSQGISYGENRTFTTGANKPTITTTPPINVTATSATCGGNITDDGGDMVTERGVCWSTNSDPTVDDTYMAATSGGQGSFTLDITGLIPGITYHVRAYATNGIGISYGEDLSFTTGITTPTVTTTTPSNVTPNSAVLGGRVISDGGATITKRGICLGTNPNPTISDIQMAASMDGNDSFSLNISGLSHGVTYHVRAYAKNSQGIGYGEDMTFTTGLEKPVVFTLDPTEVTSNSATFGGDVTSDGGAAVTERGVCWNISPNPTTSGNHQAASSAGTGTFTVNVTGLTPGTTYHVRAYAKNSQGTSYGEDKAITLYVNAPTVTTATPSNVTATSATMGGDVTSDGGAEVTERGVCWSTSSNPTVNGNHKPATTWGTGNFTVDVSDLTAETTYHVRAYAKNTQGTSYGEVKTFTTPPTGAINGLFSVSATQQVYFSQGNLQFKVPDTWRFAVKQYYCIGDANSNISESYNNWIDLFSWGTSGYNHGANCYQPWSTSMVNSDYYAYGSSTYNLYDQTGQADWGYNAISNGGNQTNLWRTLSHDEWKYLLTGRPGSDNKCGGATVNGVHGVVLLPDSWTLPEGCSFTAGMNGWNNNTYSIDQWDSMESAGAIFLPAAGYRSGTAITAVGSYGHYWASSYKSNSNAWNIYFYVGLINAESDDYRNYGKSVRLVRSAQ